MRWANNAGGGNNLRLHSFLEQAETLEFNLTMRLHILSDLHLEFRAAKIRAVDADAVVFPISEDIQARFAKVLIHR